MVRRVETLRERCDVAERVLRAVGSCAYESRIEPLLVGISHVDMHCTVRTNVMGRNHSPCDIPAICHSWGTLSWSNNGKCSRSGGKPTTLYVLYSVLSYCGGDRVECTKEQLYDYLREGFK